MSKPNIVLIAPSIKESISFGVSDGVPRTMALNFGTYPPLGLCSIAAFLLRQGMKVDLIDIDAERFSLNASTEKAISLEPDIIGINSMTFTFAYALRLARALKSKTKIPIIIGGNHVSLYPEEVMSHSCFDAGVIGEGEQTFAEVITALTSDGRDGSGKCLENIKGVVFRKNGKVVRNEARELVSNLDELPFPAVELLKIENYCGCNLKKPYMTMITSRGCPFNCYFCSKVPWGDTYRYHSAERVVSEVERLIKEFGIKSVDFFDDTFTVDKGRTLKIIELIKQKDLHFDFGIMTRADLLDEGIIRPLKDAGCKIIAIGVESGSKRVLRALNKSLDLERIHDAFKTANRLGIRTVGFFMIGNPEETEYEIKETIKFIRQLKADWFKANILIPYPGSRLYDSMLDSGKLSGDYWRDFTLNPSAKSPPLANTAINRKKLIRMRDYIDLMPYIRLRSNIFKFCKIKSFDDFKRSLYNVFSFIIGSGHSEIAD